MIECPDCDGQGCLGCEDGYFRLSGCAKKFVGREITQAINYAGMCGNGDWPVEGGLLQQSAWFLNLKQFWDGEMNRLQNERLKDSGS